MNGIAELLARVEAASGAFDWDKSEEAYRLDVDLAMFFGLYKADGNVVINQFGRVFVDGRLDYTARRYTASIDAAVALVEKVLPGWEWRIEPGFAFLLECVGSGEDRLGNLHSAKAATTPLALIAALLRALPSPVHPQEG